MYLQYPTISSDPETRVASLVSVLFLVCKFIASALRCWVWRRPASPAASMATPLPLCTTIKPASSLRLSTVRCRHSQRSHSFCHAVSLPSRRLTPVSGPDTPTRTTCCAQSPPANLLHDNLGPLAILRRSTLLRWPPALIRPSLHQTFLVDGLALTTACLVVSGVGCLLVCWP
jgi:hypothetical protein